MPHIVSNLSLFLSSLSLMLKGHATCFNNFSTYPSVGKGGGLLYHYVLHVLAIRIEKV